MKKLILFLIIICFSVYAKAQTDTLRKDVIVTGIPYRVLYVMDSDAHKRAIASRNSPYHPMNCSAVISVWKKLPTGKFALVRNSIKGNWTFEGDKPEGWVKVSLQKPQIIK